MKIEDCILHRFICKGTTIERDTTCDSNFMMEHIRLIGKSIREKFHWVDDFIPIFLIMDNAGGHGTNKTKKEYERILLDEYNVIIIGKLPIPLKQICWTWGHGCLSSHMWKISTRIR